MKLTEAQTERVRALEDARGVITPAQVVTDAKDKASPLHDLFEWNKSKAAEAHWIDRAREIIGSVRVVVTTETTTIRTPHYVHDPSASGQGYRSVTALKAEPAQARESMIYTLDVAAGHLRRAFDLAGPLGLEKEIDALLADVAGVQRLLREAA